VPSYKPDFASHAREHALKPKREELLRVFGESSYRERTNPLTGKPEWRIRARGRRKMQVLREMMAPAMRESAQRGRKLESLVPKVALNDGSNVAAWTAEDVCRRAGVRERRVYRVGAGVGARPDRHVRLRCGHSRWLGPDDTFGECPLGCGAQMEALDG